MKMIVTEDYELPVASHPVVGEIAALPGYPCCQPSPGRATPGASE
ncbi:hypothetical protein [Klebsiella quasipneumoniae]|nr:hypothetical protein [Klebsiella quasipneumoniae]